MAFNSDCSEDHCPLFTPEDEKHELQSLSVGEIQNVNADLLGINTGVARLSLENGRQLQDALLRLDVELSSIPDVEKKVYLEAQEKCPELISANHKKAFLRTEAFDVKRAALRLVKYWNNRYLLFGAEKWHLPLTLCGALADDHVAVSHCMYRLSPVRDEHGRRVLFFDVRYYDRSNYSWSSLIRAAWYILEVALENPDVLENGLVLLGHPRWRRFDQFNPKVPKEFFNLFVFLPLSLRSMHLCHPNPLVYYVASPVLKHIMGKKFRLRLRFHMGSEEKVLSDLSTYGLPKDRLPTEIGGGVVIDQEKWMNDRLLEENDPSFTPWWGSSLQPPVTNHGLTQPDEEDETFGRWDAKKLKGEQSIIVPKLTAKGRIRKQGDPRMNRAVEAKLATPYLSLQDALLAGGFVFKEDANADAFLSDRDIYDCDNVSLAQRKNQLGRRMRQARKQGAGSVGTSGTVRAKGGGMDVGVDHVTNGPCDHYQKIVPREPSNDSKESVMIGSKGGDAVLLQGDCSTPKRNSCECETGGKSASRRDSFYDSILELPGLDDLV